MSEKIVVVVFAGRRETHIAGLGGYATLCGLDGDDPHSEQVPGTVDKGDKVTCHDCFALWRECQKFRRHDFHLG